MGESRSNVAAEGATAPETLRQTDRRKFNKAGKRVNWLKTPPTE